jgi:hypothetical protein
MLFTEDEIGFHFDFIISSVNLFKKGL